MSTISYRSMVDEARDAGGQHVAVERHEGWALVRLEDPESLNALSAPLTIELQDRLDELDADPDLRAIVITGADPAFSAGGDLRLMRDVAHPLVDESDEGATAPWRWIRHRFGGIVKLIARSDTIYVAAINGATAGVGLSFAMACDLVVASDRARMLTAFGKIGLVPEVGLSWLLTRRLGHQRTMELFLSGRILDAGEAHELGLVNEVVPHAELLDRARHWCERVGALPAHAVEMTKPLLRNAADMTWEQAIVAEEFAEPMCFTTRDHRAAVRELLGESDEA